MSRADRLFQVTKRSYGQFCGIAKGLELAGERWALLIVRELLLRPRRFTDLRESLSRIPTNVLTSRLKEMESAGILQRRVLPRPASSVVYELTPYGRELEDILLRLGRWGAESLPEPEPGKPGWVDPSIRALRLAFRPDAAADLDADFEIRFGTFTCHAIVRDQQLESGPGSLENPDLVIDVRSSLTPLLAGEVSASLAIESGRVSIEGYPELLERFAQIFRIPPDFSMGDD